MSNLDLTAVVNVHKEGLWAHKAIRSALAAIERMNAELLVVLDSPDKATHEIALRAIDGYENARSLEVHRRDLGLARNDAVVRGDSRYVAFLDGDDVWGVSWPRRAVEYLDATSHKAPHNTVAHPFVHVDFGEALFWWTQPDQRSSEWPASVFWHNNCWSSVVVARRELLLAHPYAPKGGGFGYEDWEWNARTVAAGVVHVTVPETVTFIRKRSDGLGAACARENALPRHSKYFEAAPESFRPVGSSVPVPSVGPWLYDEWRSAHRIEPELWPDARTAQKLKRYAVGEGTSHEPALAIASRVSFEPTHVILAPHLSVGGADKRIVDYATAVVDRGGKPLVILTDRSSDGSWQDKTPEGVHVVDASQPLELAAGGAKLALARLVARWRPGVVHVVNSQRGYAMLARHGAAVASSCGRVYASIYGAEESGGMLGGAAFNGMFFPARAHVARVLSDNGAMLDLLAEVHGWRDATVVPSVVETLDEQTYEALSRERAAGPKGFVRVLWASRMERCKRLDRLKAVADLALARRLPVGFAVAGQPCDARSRKWAESLRGMPNVKLSLGRFDGWSALLPGKHDVYMCTSESEGMPNTLLEAAARGLAIVSSHVGDVGRVPGARVVEDPDDPAQWLSAVVEHAASRRQETLDYVARRHSKEAFATALGGAGYFDFLKE